MSLAFVAAACGSDPGPTAHPDEVVRKAPDITLATKTADVVGAAPGVTATGTVAFDTGADKLVAEPPPKTAPPFGVMEPGAVLDAFAERRLLPEVDAEAEEKLAAALEDMPKELRRRVLLAYLGFPFYDAATLPLLQNEGLTEFQAVKVDRISPEDARSIRTGGTRATLRGTEFYNFGAFFSRAYRENDYLWGRLHGAERMIDLVASTVDGFAASELEAFKRRAFLAVLDEEEGRLKSKGLVEGIRSEVE